MARHFTSRIKRGYGWKKGPDRPIEHVYEAPRMATLPRSVDLTPGCPLIYDQGQLGSCTAHAAAALAQFLMKKAKIGNYIPSRLALYWWNRFQDGTVNEDAGSSMYSAIKTLVLYGVPKESLWTYADEGDKFTQKPPKPVWSDGYWHAIRREMSVPQNLTSIKTRLAQGYPIIFGFAVYSSFESATVAQTGIMPMPKRTETILGGHAVMAVGYDDSTSMIKVRNSWGTGWGKQGYFFMPYAFITNPNYCDDFWTAENYVRFGQPTK